MSTTLVLFVATLAVLWTNAIYTSAQVQGGKSEQDVPLQRLPTSGNLPGGIERETIGTGSTSNGKNSGSEVPLFVSSTPRPSRATVAPWQRHMAHSWCGVRDRMGRPAAPWGFAQYPPAVPNGQSVTGRPIKSSGPDELADHRRPNHPAISGGTAETAPALQGRNAEIRPAVLTA